MLANSITVFDNNHRAFSSIASYFVSKLELIIHSIYTPTFWLMLLGILLAWFFVVVDNNIAKSIKSSLSIITKILQEKYWFDKFNYIVFVKGAQKTGNVLWRISDVRIIDDIIVNGSAKFVALTARVIRPIQTGYLYHYAFFMIIAMTIMLSWVLYSYNNNY